MKRFTALALILLTSCTGPIPADIPTDQDWMVIVSTVRLPDTMDWYTRFAEHTWIDLKNGDEDSWTRIEITDTSSGVVISPLSANNARNNIRWHNPAFILESFHGEEARQLIPQILATAQSIKDYGHREYIQVEGATKHRFLPPTDGRLYDAWPGPNSNTLIAQIIDATPGLHAELHHNAVGKDYPDIFHFGITASGYGLEADVGYLGLGVGLRQGIELHIIGLTTGISLWPPALKIPLLPRIGVHQGWVGTTQ